MMLQREYPKEWNSWRAMKSRCLSPNNQDWNHYGGRGIRICKKWMTFRGFFEDMGPKPSPDMSLDRKNTNGHYSKKNCRWATVQEQRENMRSNVWITRNGFTKTASAWGRKLSIPKVTVVRRHRAGRPITG
jgi:hypothetical protein